MVGGRFPTAVCLARLIRQSPFLIGVHHEPGFVGYFGSLGLPAVVAYAVIALELFGGLALILGVYAPWVALPLALEMLGTIVLVHGANGWLFTSKGGGWEYPAFWVVGLIVLYLLGDGAMALRPAQRERA